MRIIIYAGPGEVQKRSQLQATKKQFSSDLLVNINFKESSWPAVLDSLSQTALFASGPQLVIVENANENLDISNLATLRSSATLLLLVSSLPEKSKLYQSAKSLGAQILRFEAEKELPAFNYLDHIVEGQSKAFIELEKLLSVYDGIYLLAMIYYLLRRNVLPLPAGSFISQKITKQKKLLDFTILTSMYYWSLTTEYQIKRGLVAEHLGMVTLTQKLLEQTSRNQL